MATATELFESGMAALGRGDFLAATQAFQEFVDLDPDNADAWLYLGMAVLPRNFARARAALDRALAIAPGHVGVLYWRAEADWLDGNPLAASEFLRQIAEVAPDAPQNLARLGFARLAAGDRSGGDDALLKAVNAGSGLSGVRASHTELRRAVYLDMLGRSDEAARLIRLVNRAGVSPAVSRERYPRDLGAQRHALETAVSGRDIIILGSGPSLADLPPLLTSMKSDMLRQLCFFGFNNVPVAERMLVESAGREIDLALMTSAEVMRLHQEWISQFLNRTRSPNLFLTLTASLPADGPIAAKPTTMPEKFFYFSSSGDYPPIPEDPLHFPPVNTLLCVLPLAVLARPRRIFLFGCDGAAAVGDDNAQVYFRQGSDDYGNQEPPRAKTYASWLARDTFFFNSMVSTVLRSLAVLHRIPVPPIYICNPDSAYRPFPRIPAKEFIRVQSSPVENDTNVLFGPGRVQQWFENLRTWMQSMTSS